MADSKIDSWISIEEKETLGDKEGFLRAIKIWREKPHVINRRLSGAANVCNFSIERNASKNFYESTKDLLKMQDATITIKELENRFKINSSNDHCSYVEVCVRKLLPKQLDKVESMLEVITIDTAQDHVTFMPVKGDSETEPDDSSNMAYRMALVEEHSQNKIILQVPMNHKSSAILKRDGVTCPTIDWLKTHLLPKLCHWAGQDKTGKITTSQRLIDTEEYVRMYVEMKKKHGEELVKIWPEKTDPQKFVYEDVAIATYLMLLWKKERKVMKLDKLQSFVDIGCGNGLLVYILNQEGHPGRGVDIRKRKIWDMYGDKANLEVIALDPSSPESTFPQSDWLIGNHSDELTPWIPVMASRTSLNTRYFVLPCCPFDFTGKYNRSGSGDSQYRSYLNYVKTVGETCGFHVEEDIMRIPSTKRICHVGSTRSVSDAKEVHNSVMKMLEAKGCYVVKDKQEIKRKATVQDGEMSSSLDNEKLNKNKKLRNSDDSQSPFQPRASVEPIRNCTTVHRDLKNKIVNKVAMKLLELPPEGDNSQQSNNSDISQTKWNKGGVLHLSKVSVLFDKEDLQQLKNECGGLQTLLKNHHQIFAVYGGHVRLRDWCAEVKKKKPSEEQKSRWKCKPCWFFHNHPDKCPLKDDSQCPYSHDSIT